MRLRFGGRDLVLSVVNLINSTQNAGPQDPGFLWVQDLKAVYFGGKVCILEVLFICGYYNMCIDAHLVY